MAVNLSKLIRTNTNDIDVDWPTLSRSPELEKYLTTLMDSLSMRGRGGQLKLQLDFNPQGDIAYTNGNKVYLNMENDLQKQMSSLRNRFKVTLGILFHEMAHVRFTDFDRSYELLRQIKNGEFPVGRPHGRQEDVDELEMALKDPRTRGFFKRIYAELENYAIDAHDEERLIEAYAIGGRMSLVEQSIRRTRMCLEAISATVDPVVQKADKTGDYLHLMMMLIFQYIRFGEIIVKDEQVKDHPAVQSLAGFMVDADIAAQTDDTDERFMALNRIVVKLWPFIRETIEKVKQQAQQSQSQQGGSSQPQSGSQNQQGSTSQQTLGSGQGQTGDGVQSEDESQGQQGEVSQQSQTDDQSQAKGNAQPQGSQGQQGEGSSSPITADDIASALDQLQKTLKDALEGAQKTKAPENRTGSGDKSDKGKDGSDSSQKKGSEDSGSSSAENKESSDTSEEGGTDSHQSQQESASAQKGDGEESPKEIPSKTAEQAKKDSVEDSSEEDGEDDSSMNALRSLLQAVKEAKAKQKVDDEISQKMRELIRNTDAGSSHRGIPVKPDFIGVPSESDQRAYRMKLEKVKSYSTRIQRTLNQELEMFSKGYTQRYRPFGKGLDARDAYRPDQKFFTNKKLPHDLPEMAVAVLIDMSGSTIGERNEASIDMAILVEDFCRGMNIPVMIAGHHMDSGGMAYHIFSKFDEVSPSSRAKVMRMIPSIYGNRDGLAITVTKELLQKRPEEIKLMFIISDGLPYDHGYSGEPARKDIKQIVRDAEKNGIETFAAAIGDDKDAIEAIYGDSFLDITNLSKLPKILVSLIKKRIQKSIR